MTYGFSVKIAAGKAEVLSAYGSLPEAVFGVYGHGDGANESIGVTRTLTPVPDPTPDPTPAPTPDPAPAPVPAPASE